MRRWWKIWQTLCDARRLVFLDETSLNTKMARLYGRSRIGRRCHGSLPHGHWHACTFLAGLRCDGLSAPMLFDGALNGELFLAYVEQQLAPTLQPGDVLICDNLSVHKVAGVKEAIEARGACLFYLPPYSPDLNPIEQAFSKLKAHLRKACARTWDGLLLALRHALKAFTPQHCLNFFRNSNYVAA
jgi:transposase